MGPLVPVSSNLIAVEQALTRCDQVIQDALQAMGLRQAPPQVQPARPVLPVTGPALPVGHGGFPGDKSAELYAAFKEAAKLCNFHPVVLYAIWCWETGRGADPHAGPWIHGWNPGGLHWNSLEEARTLGAIDDPYVSSGTHTKYLAFATWYDGILGLGRFLARSHYNEARIESTAEEQGHAIWAAGYSELSEEWLSNVTRIIRTSKLETASATNAAVPNVERRATLSDQIVAALLSIVGHPKKSPEDEFGDKDPVFHYPSDTENGNLGCASAMSAALIVAGAITKGEFQKSVSGLAHLLVDNGWTAKPRPDRNADMIIWKPVPGGTHQHIGGLVVIDGKQYAVENSSSRRVVEKVLLSDFNRSVSYALQCPA